MMKDGRNATQPYRVRANGVWYWVDPTVPGDQIEPGDTVVVYPVNGDAVVATLQARHGDVIMFSTPQGERGEVAGGDIAALQLAAVDEEQ